ncbi:DEAD/DEAH box helicase [Streptomyces sp. NPDC003077]|uniref:DEAD/DEAH box helicase n=1 Tax=Streptomyces sp. NPDC003077 TaxID=3154443 RepID=UPI0033AA424D
MAPSVLPSELSQCAAVFLPGDPPRSGRIAFWRPDGTHPATEKGAAAEDLTVAVPGADRQVVLRTVPAVVLPVADALPVLTRARLTSDADPAAAFWGAASLLALHLIARGRLLPGLSPRDHDAWRLGPLDSEDTARLRELAAAMPPYAHAVPLPDTDRLALPDPGRLLRAFCDAVADGLPRTPAAHLATGGPAFAAHPPRHIPEQRAWAAEVAAGHDAGVRVSLRIEVNGLTEGSELPSSAPSEESRSEEFRSGESRSRSEELRSEGFPYEESRSEEFPFPSGQFPSEEIRNEGSRSKDSLSKGSRSKEPLPEQSPHNDAPPVTFTAVLQLHSLGDAALVADASEVWAGSTAAGRAFGSRARMDTLLALRRAVGAWGALAPLLSAPVPDALPLADDEVAELLGPASRALAAAGVQVHWPRDLARGLVTRAVVGAGGHPGDGSIGDEEQEASRGRFDRTSGAPSMLSADALLSFDWRFSLGGQEVSRAELERLAESHRPLVRLRDQWVLIAPEELRAARDRQDHKVTPIDALGAALTGAVEDRDGERVEVRATGWLARLRDRLADPEGGHPAGSPDGSTERAAFVQPAALAATLRDYQVRGLAWLDRMTSLGLGGCLADDMGLGKTITLIALHLHRQSHPDSVGPTLVVCPTSLMGNWQREIERFAPGTPVRRFHAGRRSLDDLKDGEFVLTTYGTMRLDAPKLARAGWGLVVADEAQHVKNPFSATAKALRAIPARARVALTGTPVENNLSELWAILDWTTPGLLGPLGRFRRRYAQAVEGGADPAAAERLARLVRPFLLRRRKSDPGIAPELPPKTETDRAVALTGEQAGLYEAVVREGLEEIQGADGFARRGLVVKLLTSLKQICNHPAQFLKESEPVVPGRSGKVELLDELLDTMLAEGASVLVFTQYVQMARLLERHLGARGIATQTLHGGTPVARREEMVHRFQEGETPVFLLSLKAAGTGLNLTRAAHVVHFDRWWNPAVEAQATDRAYRIGQTQPVQVHRLITEGTVEDRIADMLARKQRLADAVLGSGEAALTELTDAELADLVALRGSER